jgi:nucleoside-diphosphate-sugar epimerase
MNTVLVTGGSGFIAGHTILQLLAAGHRVRTTVRSTQREGPLRATLKSAGAGAVSDDALTASVANLLEDAGWPQAIGGCDYVLHMASPFPLGIPAHENDLIVPAREGTLRVLRLARDAGVRRVVLTSSFAAIGYGHRPRTVPFSEADWTDPAAPGLTAYVKSKTLAERAAWDFIAQQGGALELSVVNPVAVVGPVLGPDFAASIQLVKRMLDGGMPGCPRLSFGVVDVRDVADLHLRAMSDPAARGERFLAVAGDFISLIQIANLLRDRLGEVARKVPRREFPDWIVRLGALFNPAARQILPELGKFKNATNEKARRVLHWAPKSNAESLIATADSLVRLNLIKDSGGRTK